MHEKYEIRENYEGFGDERGHKSRYGSLIWYFRLVEIDQERLKKRQKREV